MAGDPWAVVSTGPAAPAPPAADPWAVVSTDQPAAAKPAAPAAPPKPDKGVLQSIFDSMSAAGLAKMDAAKAQPGPQMPSVDDMIGAVTQPFKDAGHAIAEDVRAGAPPVPSNFKELLQANVDSAARTGHLFQAPMAPLAAANDVVSVPASKALGLPKSAVDAALFALAPEKGGARGAARAAEGLEGAAATEPHPVAETPPAATPGATPADPWTVVAEGKPPPSPEALAAVYDQQVKPLVAKTPEPMTPEGITDDHAGLVPRNMAEGLGVDLNKPAAVLPDQPGPILESAPKSEALATPEVKATAAASRADDALFRLGGNATADKIEAKAFLQSPEFADPQLRAKLYDETEARMANPGLPLSPDVQAVADRLQPWKAEEGALSKKIADAGYGEGPNIDPDAYVHRVVKGKGSYFDEADLTENASTDPTFNRQPRRPGNGGLGRDASSLHGRKFMVTEDAAGNRQFVKEPPPSMQVGEPFMDLDAQVKTPKYATTAEIEANTPYRYHHDAVVNTVDNVLRLRRVSRNIDTLAGLKTQAENAGLIHYPQTKGDIPPGYVEVTLPQFNGAYAEPKLAHTLNDFHGKLQAGGWSSAALDALTAVNRFLTSAIFFTPVPHAWNVANHWATSRGWDWLRPSGYKSLMVDGSRAVKAVVTQNADYQHMLREGSGLTYGGVANRDFYKVMIKKLGGEIRADPKGWNPIAQMFGLKDAANLVKTMYRLSSKSLWAVNDMFMLQRQFELMRKMGVDGQALRSGQVRSAIAEAEREIPNYRMPSHVGFKGKPGRALSEVMRNPNLMMFGRYRYGQFKAYAEPLKDLLSAAKTPAQRTEAAGKFFIMAAMAMGAYPMLDKMAQALWSNPDASMHRGGGLTIPSAVAAMFDKDPTKHKNLGDVMGSVAQPAPAISLAGDMKDMRDDLGRPIVEPRSSHLGQAVQAAEYGASKIAPLAMISAAGRPGGMGQQAAQALAMKNPREQTLINKRKAVRYDQRRAARREANSPLEKAVKGAFGVE